MVFTPLCLYRQKEGYTSIEMFSKGSLERIDAMRRLGPLYDYFEDEVYYDVDIDPRVATVEQVFQEMLNLLIGECVI